ncbi:MAG: S9 family peptidase [Bacteroidota bacterium]
MKNFAFSVVVLILCLPSLQAQISLEQIWGTYEFFGENVAGFNFRLDGRHYTRLERNQIVEYDLETGARTQVLLRGDALPAENGWTGQIEDYEFSADEEQLIISTANESIYRHSSRGYYFIYDIKSETLTPVYPEAKHRLASLSPDATKVAFVHANNLYVKDLASGDVKAITSDGENNSIINGATDWVYEEEFSFHRGFHWSPNGSYIAFYRFDETEVPEFTFANYHDNLYPDYITFKYPKVGEANSQVSIHTYELATAETKEVMSVNDSPEQEWHYIPRITWTTQDNELVVYRMNRHQNKLELLLHEFGPRNRGSVSTLLEEESEYYVDIHDNLTFLEDGRQFIWTSEQSGYNHIYLGNKRNQNLVQLTSGEWEVTNFYGVDEENGSIYFQAAMRDPMQREVYTKSLDGKDLPRAIAGDRGSNSATFSSTFDYFVHRHSTINQPLTVTVRDRAGSSIREIITNAQLAEKQARVGVQPVEFFDFTTSEDVTLNGYMIKPENMGEGREHPVLMFVYGGPGSQQVRDSWRGQNYWWFQMLVQQGFVVACVDNRGTGARGEEFKKMTYLELGKYETMDQIEAARYLGSLDYIDEDRIGIFGWSYGGYMSSLCILKGADVFSTAIAVAPVTSWKWYDSIYTERYMRTLAENESGYRDNSPIYFADQLEGDYLLVHGMGDDNVHFQHTAEMAHALIMANKQFDTYFYPNRNHGIYGGPTRLHLYQKMTDFLMESIGPEMEVEKRPLEIELEEERD